jgi:hypothetical protein
MDGTQVVNGMQRVGVATAAARLEQAIGRTVVVFLNPGEQVGTLRAVRLISGTGPRLEIELDTAFGQRQIRSRAAKVLHFEGDRYFWPLCPVLIGPGTDAETLLGVDPEA